MFIRGDNSNNNNTLYIDKKDESGIHYICEFSTSLGEQPEIIKKFYARKADALEIFKKEGELLKSLLLNDLRIMYGEKQIIIGLGPGRSGSMSLALFFAAQPVIMSHHESNPKLRWDASIFEFIGKWADLLSGVVFPLPVISDVAFWYLPFVDYIKYVCPKTKFVCLRRDTEEIVNSFMLKYFDTSAWTNRHSEHWRSEWVRGNPFLESFPSYDLPKEEGCRRYVQEYYQKAEELEKRYTEDFKIFDINDLNTDEGKATILRYCNIPEDMMKVQGNFKTNITTERHAEIQRQWKDRFGEES